VYSVGPERSGAIATRIECAADRFVQLGFASSDALDQSIRDDAIDVLFDLNGYSESQLLDALARRPATMQVNFLGYTGTLGCSAYDYILADSYCITEAAESWYTERVLRVDPCYLPSDSSREISAEPLRRASYGLPDNALVLCCFAPVYKILPDFLDGLQPILGTRADVVLWLRHAEADVARRIRAEAQARGIAAQQIVFAPPDATARYLARFRLADLFIDTFPFGAHTTVNDALFAGLPVLAVAGRSFASRASASQVRAAGLPDFVSESVPEHFTKLRALLDEPQLLAEGARRLRSGAANAALFDLDRYARTFERVIREAWDAHN
jgi:protein O-GlcNAc transferase